MEFLFVLLALLLLVVACCFYFSRGKANYDPQTRSYAWETPEVREKNRKAVRAWLAKQRAARQASATVSPNAQQVKSKSKANAAVGASPVSGIASSSDSSNRITDALLLGSMAYAAARSAGAYSSVLQPDINRKESASSLSNDDFHENPEVWSEAHPDSEDGYEREVEDDYDGEDGNGYEDYQEDDNEFYSYDGGDGDSDSWEEHYEDESDW